MSRVTLTHEEIVGLIFVKAKTEYQRIAYFAEAPIPSMADVRRAVFAKWLRLENRISDHVTRGGAAS